MTLHHQQLYNAQIFCVRLFRRVLTVEQQQFSGALFDLRKMKTNPIVQMRHRGTSRRRIDEKYFAQMPQAFDRIEYRDVVIVQMALFTFHAFLQFLQATADNAAICLWYFQEVWTNAGRFRLLLQSLKNAVGFGEQTSKYWLIVDEFRLQVMNVHRRFTRIFRWFIQRFSGISSFILNLWSMELASTNGKHFYLILLTMFCDCMHTPTVWSHSPIWRLIESLCTDHRARAAKVEFFKRFVVNSIRGAWNLHMLEQLLR